MSLRALIIGCGRMGAGRDHVSPWLYSHPEAYLALRDRVELVGFVDRVFARAEWAADKYKVPFAGDHIAGALRQLQPDVVSVCTPPSDRGEVIAACEASTVRGIWCEKPFWLPTAPTIPTQVNYIRRFDRRHREIRERRADKPWPDRAHLIAIAANDIHTTCHFADLARWWFIQRDEFTYLPFHGPSLYILREPGPLPGRYAGWNDQVFTGGGVETGFMELALSNLLDAIEGGRDLLISPAEEAIESEQWAAQVIAEQ